VIAPDEATARAMADKFDIAIATPIENPNLIVCPDCHHMVSRMRRLVLRAAVS
jgi:predicted HNH restriction endonuclease